MFEGCFKGLSTQNLKKKFLKVVSEVLVLKIWAMKISNLVSEILEIRT